jgi:hypothetical protein
MKRKAEKPVPVEIGEWRYFGCFIQEQPGHLGLLRYHVFQDTPAQTTIGVCHTFDEAKAICRHATIRCSECGHIEHESPYSIAQRAMGHALYFNCNCGNQIKLNPRT